MRVWLFAVILIGLLAGCAGPSAPLALTPMAFPTPAAEATSTPALLVRKPTDTPIPTDTPAPTGTPTPVTTSLILWENLPPAQAEKLAAEINVFYQTYPYTMIEVQHYDDPQMLSAAIIEGRVDYDIILGSAPLLASLEQMDKLQPMSDFFPASFLDGFAGVTLTGATRRDRLWGLPDTAGFHLLLFYNADLVETPPVSTSELVALAEDLTNQSQRGLVMNSADPLWVLPWWRGYGGRLVDKSGATSFDTGAMIKALELYLTLNSGTESEPLPADYVEMREMFVKGRAAMMIDGEWAIGELSTDDAISWRVAPLPAIDGEGAGVSSLVLGRYWAVGANSTGRHTESAIAFLEFVTRPERQLAWTEQFGLLPTRRAALTSPEILTNSVLRVSAQQLQSGQGVPLGIDLNALLDAMRDPLRQLLTGAFSPDEAADLMADNFR